MKMQRASGPQGGEWRGGGATEDAQRTFRVSTPQCLLVCSTLSLPTCRRWHLLLLLRVVCRCLRRFISSLILKRLRRGLPRLCGRHSESHGLVAGQGTVALVASGKLGESGGGEGGTLGRLGWVVRSGASSSGGRGVGDVAKDACMASATTAGSFLRADACGGRCGSFTRGCCCCCSWGVEHGCLFQLREHGRQSKLHGGTIVKLLQLKKTSGLRVKY